MKTKVLAGVLLVIFMLSISVSALLANGAKCAANSDCTSNKCLNTVCCGANQCGGIDDDGKRKCFALNQENDFGMHVCVSQGVWKTTNGFSCEADTDCKCGNCVDTSSGPKCCGTPSAGGAMYFRPKAPSHPDGQGYFSMSVYMNKKITGPESLNWVTIKETDSRICYPVGGKINITITSDPEGEFYSVGGPTDSPPIHFVDNMTDALYNISHNLYPASSMDPLVTCNYLKRCDPAAAYSFYCGDDQPMCTQPLWQHLGGYPAFCTQEADEASVQDSCACLTRSAVVCSAPCTTKVMGGNARMINRTTLEVTGVNNDEMHVFINTTCTLTCYQYWKNNYFPHSPDYDYMCSWYHANGSVKPIALGINRTIVFKDLLNFTIVPKDKFDLTKPNLTVVGAVLSGNVLLVTLNNTGSYNATLRSATLAGISQDRYVVSPYLGNNKIIVPKGKINVWFTINNMSGIRNLSALFEYYYDKGGDCNGEPTTQVNVSVPVVPKSVTLSYRILNAPNGKLKCALLIKPFASPAWVVNKTWQDLDQGDLVNISLPNIQGGQYKWKVACNDSKITNIPPKDANDADGRNFTVVDY